MNAILVLLFLLPFPQGPIQKASQPKSLPFKKLLIDKLPEVHYVGMTDMDGDGDQDLLGSSIAGAFFWYENTGTFPSFSARKEIGFAAGAGEMQGVDLDGDQDTDILFSAIVNGTFGWFENDGSQNFTMHIIDTESTWWAENVTPVDMDGDQDWDFVGLSWVGNTVAWWENDGTQNFTRHLVGNTATPHGSARVLDINGDGSLDIAVAGGISTASGQISWFENDGNQNFTEHYVDSGALFHAVQVLDMDGDEDLDLVGARYTDSAGRGSFRWYENDGRQNFTTHFVDPNYSLAAVLAVDDFNLDGKWDVLGGGLSDGTLYWYRNQGGSPLQFQKILVGENFPVDGSILTHDFDGDGDKDVLSGSGNGEVAIWINRFR